MNQNRNYQKELEKLLLTFQKQDNGYRPSLLLHSCCAPCSSYCMEYLREYFDLTVFYYNPNITEKAEYRKRVEEEKRLIAEYNRQVEEQDFTGMESTSRAGKIQMIDGDYEPDHFYQAVRGLESCREGGARCFSCYELRLRKTAELAKEKGFSYFTTTLTISPLKNAVKLNEIGEALSKVYGVSYLPSDFKKKNGYKRSIVLSAQFGLYRQDYCGCGFSKAQRELEKQTIKEN